MDKPRVIFINRVYRPSQAATAQLLTDLAEALAARDWPVQVIAAGDESGPLNGVTVHRTGPDVQPDGLLSRLLANRRFVRAARNRLKQIIRPGDTVVLLTDPPLLGTRLARTVLDRGARLVHWIQDIYPEILTAHAGGWTGPLLIPLRSRRNDAWRAAHWCVTLGHDMAATLTAQGVSPERVRQVANWAPRELDSPARAAAVAAHRQQWDVPAKLVVAYSGNLGRVHEFKAILTAATILRDRTDIMFLFIGAGHRWAEVNVTVQQRQLGNVRFLPPEARANLATSLSAADIQLVSLKAAFTGLVYPSKLAGILAAGRPVLFAGPAGSEIARLIAAEDCGLTVAPDDGPALAKLLASWPRDREAQGRNARVVYEKQFTFARALDQWEEILGSHRTKA